MSVYVTETKKIPKNSHWRWPRKAFLFADSRRELHDFAYHLGLHPYMFINRPHFPCYPVTVCKRYKALDYGAIPRSDNETIDFINKSTLCMEPSHGN